jgi:hypothetical protein
LRKKFLDASTFFLKLKAFPKFLLLIPIDIVIDAAASTKLF